MRQKLGEYPKPVM